MDVLGDVAHHRIGTAADAGVQDVAGCDLVCLLEGEAVERYLRQNPTVSIQSKINMLNDRLRNKIKEEFLGKGIKYTDPEKKAILKAYRVGQCGQVVDIEGCVRDGDRCAVCILFY